MWNALFVNLTWAGEMDITPFIGPIISVLVALFTFYGMVGQRLTKLETKMDDLSDDVRKHNGVIERTFIVERDLKTMWARHDELKERVHELESYHKKEA